MFHKLSKYSTLSLGHTTGVNIKNPIKAFVSCQTPTQLWVLKRRVINTDVLSFSHICLPVLSSNSTFMARNSSYVSCRRTNSWLTCRMPRHRSYMADCRIRSLGDKLERPVVKNNATLSIKHFWHSGSHLGFLTPLSEAF